MEKSRAILGSVLAALRGVAEFSEATLGSESRAGGLPRASVAVLGEHTRAADDAESTWRRLRLEVAIAAAGHGHAESLERSLELAEKAREALLADVFRGGLTKHLPWGKATEVGGMSIGDECKGPGCQVRFEVACHYETQGGA